MKDYFLTCSSTYVYDFGNNIELPVDYSHWNVALKIRQKQTDLNYTLNVFSYYLRFLFTWKQAVNKNVSIWRYKEISMTCYD